MNQSLFGPRASYSYTVEDGVVCVVDHDQGKRVTNDAEAVIDDLAQEGVDLDSCRVIYRDTMGVWDELVVVNRVFAGFRSLNEQSKGVAKLKVRGLNGTR